MNKNNQVIAAAAVVLADSIVGVAVSGARIPVTVWPFEKDDVEAAKRIISEALHAD